MWTNPRRHQQKAEVGLSLGSLLNDPASTSAWCQLASLVQRWNVCIVLKNEAAGWQNYSCHPCGSERIIQFLYISAEQIFFIPGFHTRRLKLDTSFRLAFLNPLEQKWEGEMSGFSCEDGQPAHPLPGQNSGFWSQTGQGSSFSRLYFGCFTFSALEECHSWRLRLSVIPDFPCLQLRS